MLQPKEATYTEEEDAVNNCTQFQEDDAECCSQPRSKAGVKCAGKACRPLYISWQTALLVVKNRDAQGRRRHDPKIMAMIIVFPRRNPHHDMGTSPLAVMAHCACMLETTCAYIEYTLHPKPFTSHCGSRFEALLVGQA